MVSSGKSASKGGIVITSESEIKSRMLVSTPLKLRIMEYREKPGKIADIVKSLNVPRDTIKSHIRYLSSLNLITKENNLYRTTDIGKVIINKLKEIEDLIELIEKHGEFLVSHDLSSLPEDLLRNIHLLKDCKVYTKDNPFQIRLDWAEVAKKSKWAKVVKPILHPEVLRMYPSLAKGKKEIKVILTRDVFEKLKTLYPDVLKKCMEVGEFYLCEKATEGFWVSDRQLTLYLFRNGVLDPLNVLICNSKDGIEWGLRLFDFYFKNSVKIDKF